MLHIYSTVNLKTPFAAVTFKSIFPMTYGNAQVTALCPRAHLAFPQGGDRSTHVWLKASNARLAAPWRHNCIAAKGHQSYIASAQAEGTQQGPCAKRRESLGHEECQEDDAEGSMLRALRNVFAAQSVTPEVVSSIMSKVDSNNDGLTDLRELTTALSKWLALVAYPGSRDLLHPFASARDIALDFFIAMKQDPRRGVGPAGLQSVLQALCLTARSSFDVIEDWVEATLLLPDPRLSEADTMAALEVDAALHAKGPELMSGLLQRRKLAMIFRLWDPQARGCVNRAAIAAVLEFYYRTIVKTPKEKPSAENHTGGLDVPFESQVPRAPESFQDADLQADSGEQSPQQEAQASTDEGVRGEQHREPAAGDSGKEGPAQQQAASPETDAGKQEGDRQSDGVDVGDQVMAFLEEEMRKDPPRLNFEDFQGLVRTFCELAEVPAEQVYDFLLEAALHGAIYTGPDPEENIAYLRYQAEDAMET